MILALDGVSRDLLYDEIRRGQLPNLSALIGKDAYLDETLVATLPSTTMRDDSEFPLIVANHRHRSAKVRAWVRGVLGERPSQQKVSDLMLGIRAGALE